MERTRKTSEELDLEMRRTRGPNKHLERRTARERERERDGEGERGREREVRAQVGENRGDKHGDRRSQSHQNEEHRAMEREVRAWETRRFLCPEAPRKKNSNKEGQKGLEDCNKAVKEETHMRDKECSLSQSST